MKFKRHFTWLTKSDIDWMDQLMQTQYMISVRLYYSEIYVSLIL